MRLAIIAPRGKMGKCIAKAAYEDERFEIVASVGPRGRDYIGRDTGLVTGLGVELGAPVVDDLEKVIDKCEAIIDFSTRELSLQVLEQAVKRKKPLVCGTTGFNAGELARFRQAAAAIPLIQAANTSKLVNLMNRLLEISAAALGSEADIEIIEMHDRDKRDTPSGTSREMGTLMAEAMGGEIGELAAYGRAEGVSRRPGGIGYHSVRAGSLPSSHIVIFGLTGERLEIAHHSYNWDCFGKGACDAAYFLRDKKPGLYTIKDVLGLS